MLGESGERQIEPSHGWFLPQFPFALRITGAQQLHQVKRMFGGIGKMLFSTYSQAYNGQHPMVTFGEPLEHVITLRGPFLWGVRCVCGVAP